MVLLKLHNRRALSRILERQQEEVNSYKEGTAYGKAFELLAARIQSKILDQAATGVVLKMTEVCSLDNNLLQEQGVVTVKYRRVNPKHRLQKYFGESLQFFQESEEDN